MKDKLENFITLCNLPELPDLTIDLRKIPESDEEGFLDICLEYGLTLEEDMGFTHEYIESKLFFEKRRMLNKLKEWVKTK